MVGFQVKLSALPWHSSWRVLCGFTGAPLVKTQGLTVTIVTTMRRKEAPLAGRHISNRLRAGRTDQRMGDERTPNLERRASYELL